MDPHESKYRYYCQNIVIAFFASRLILSRNFIRNYNVLSE